MLNSTKTWQEKFDKDWGEFTSSIRRTIVSFDNTNNYKEICSLCGVNAEELGKNVKKFISDLRKRDMEALIEMLPKECEHNEWCECLEDENMPCDCGVSPHNRLVASIKKLIKDYYEN